MKSRRIAIIAFALVAVMTLGVGYAALTETLSVNTTASLTVEGAQEVFDGEVYFSAYSVDAQYTNVTAGLGTKEAPADASAKPDVAWIDINEGMSVVGDKIQVTFTVNNDSASPITVSITPGTSADGHFKTNGSMTGTSIPAESTGQIVVTVTLQTTVNETISNSVVPITFNVTSAG